MPKTHTKWKDTSTHWSKGPNADAIWKRIKDKLKAKTPWNKGLKGYHAGKAHWHWKGGRILENGYVKLYRPDHPDRDRHGYISEHRLKMEKSIGRRLSRTEIVHHKNQVRTDNRISNLGLFSSHSEHMRHGRHKMKRFPKGTCPPWLVKYQKQKGWSKRTHCKLGHELTPENTYLTTDKSRCCRICLRAYGELRRQRNK